MPFLASASGYNLTPISSLAETLRRGAADNRSNDATVALNNVLRDNFNAEKQMALNALQAMDNKYRADLKADLQREKNDLVKELADEERGDLRRAELAAVALGGSEGEAQPESNVMNDLINQFKFNQNVRNAAYNELQDFGFYPVNAVKGAIIGLPQPKIPGSGGSGSVTITQPARTAAQPVKLENFSDATNQLMDMLFNRQNSQTNNQ